MKLQAAIGDNKHEVEIKRDGGKISARVDEREYDLEASEVEPNVFLLKHENQIYQIYVAPNGFVNVGNQQLEVTLTDPKRLRGAGAAIAGADGASEIKTAMPGKLVRVLVEIGAEIKQGEPVLVVEAMKMQNEMKSPKDGIVKEIRFAEGATVNAGDVLAIIE
ncbi:MAG TPA: biotin/lipoyl-containing protein [Pyrinomonadaceae bacterium]|jgi:biotin carboxyl carrier protein